MALRLRDLSIRTKLFLLVGLALGALTTFAVLSQDTIATVMVNGPYYRRVALDKDLVADVLPPPAYVIEAYLLSHRLVRERAPGNVEALVRRGDELRVQYEARHRFWTEQLDDPELRGELLQRSAAHAREVFRVRDEVLVPLVRAGRLDEAAAALEARLVPAYEAHRSAIDRVVVLANAKAARDEAATADAVAARTVIQIVVALLLAAIVAALCLLVIRHITGALGAVTRLADDLAAGDLRGEREPKDHGADELGRMARALGVALGRLRESMHAIARHSEHLGASSRGLATASRELVSDVASTSQLATSVAASTDTIGGHIARVTQSMDELSSAVGEISRNAQRTSGVVNDAVGAAERVSGTMQRLGTASSDIARFVDIITQIASQTHMLALNASIEAARAGALGTSFAVVAQEVKALADTTRAAARDITAQVGAIDAAVSGASSAIGDVTEVVRHIHDTQSSIAAAVEEQTATCSAIRSNMHEASDDVRVIADQVANVASTIQRTSQVATATGSEATTLAGMATELQALVARFRT